jgi:hypothetical protein
LNYQTDLHVLQIQDIGLSFKTAKDLGNRAEILPTFKPHPHESHPGQDLQWVSNPQQGLRWISKKINPESPTKNNIILYYRDPLLCLQYLMHSPLVQDHISFSPFKLYENATKTMRIYTEWLSGDQAWNIQVNFPFTLLLFCSANEHIADPTWTWGNDPWCHFIFRQNEYLSDDWWPLSPPSPYQFSQHLK